MLNEIVSHKFFLQLEMVLTGFSCAPAGIINCLLNNIAQFRKILKVDLENK